MLKFSRDFTKKMEILISFDTFAQFKFNFTASLLQIPRTFNSTILDLTITYLLRNRCIHKQDESHGNKKNRTKLIFSFPFFKDFCVFLVWYCRTLPLSATSSLSILETCREYAPKVMKSQVQRLEFKHTGKY